MLSITLLVSGIFQPSQETGQVSRQSQCITQVICKVEPHLFLYWNLAQAFTS